MRQLEHVEAKALIEWWTYFARQRKIDERLLFAIPNGGLRHKAVAMKLKAEGVRSGIPDYLLAVTSRGIGGGIVPGLWIELKAPGGRTSDSQDEMLILLGRQGYALCVSHGWQQAKKAIEDYLK